MSRFDARLTKWSNESWLTISGGTRGQGAHEGVFEDGRHGGGGVGHALAVDDHLGTTRERSTVDTRLRNLLVVADTFQERCDTDLGYVKLGDFGGLPAWVNVEWLSRSAATLPTAKSESGREPPGLRCLLSFRIKMRKFLLFNINNWHLGYGIYIIYKHSNPN